MRDKIVKILTELRPEFDFSADVNFIEEGMLDSFDVVLLVAALDKEFQISIDGMSIRAENFTGVDKIVELLNKNGAVA